MLSFSKLDKQHSTSVPVKQVEHAMQSLIFASNVYVPN